MVGPPFEHVSIIQGANTNRCVPIIDLRIQVGNLELANVVCHSAHGAVAQKDSGVAIDKRNGRVIRLFDVGSKVPILCVENGGILFRITREQSQRGNSAQNTNERNDYGNNHQTLEPLRLLFVLLAFAHSALINLVEDEEHQKRREQHKDSKEHPEIDAMDVDRWMEPPVTKCCDDKNYDS